MFFAVLFGCLWHALIFGLPVSNTEASALQRYPFYKEISTAGNFNIRPEEKKKPLVIVIDNLESATAPVVMGFYSPGNDFLNEHDQYKKFKVSPRKGKLVARVSSLPYGTYAIALYQDVNSNGQLDKNALGIPQEPYAFSNNYKPVIAAPVFSDCSFEYNANMRSITIHLIK